MKISAPKYTRDFYPEDMRRREWIEAAWTRASQCAGFLPWDGPILETLDLYKRKSGEEIVSQLFNVVTMGGAELAVRPELTPSLARMIAARQASLPRPIKWYSIGRMCRYERGQRGRLREFWQWNVDLLGVDSIAGDAEIISVALDGLALLGLGSQDVEVRLNSRSMLSAMLESLGADEESHPRIFAVADKKGKLSSADLDKQYDALRLPADVLSKVRKLMDCQTLDEVDRLARDSESASAIAEVEQLHRLIEYLTLLGKGGFVRFDIGIVRGLAYYTGPVFEIFDRQGELRALCGGGRYDRLMETMGGQPMPACGFGMGDVVLGELLNERRLSPPVEPPVDFYVIPATEQVFPMTLQCAKILRQANYRVDYALRPISPGKALKKIGESGARWIAILGENSNSPDQVRFRELSSRQEKTIPLGELAKETWIFPDTNRSPRT